MAKKPNRKKSKPVKKMSQNPNRENAKPVTEIPQKPNREKLINAGLYSAAFVIPLLIMLGIMAKGDFYPFGDKSLFIMDMRDQALEFFASLRDVVGGDNSIFFNWSKSMGGNFIGLFAYYIASPLNFFTVFFPISQMPAAILILTLIKISCCGLSFMIFAKYMAKKYESARNFSLLILSVCYALMSYNMVYSLSPYWLDGVICLPLIIMGAEKILSGGKGLQYLIFLTVLFYSNYYVGYMVGIFTALYVVYRIISELSGERIKEFGYMIIRFAALSVGAAGIVAPFLVSVYQSLQEGKLASGSVGFTPDATENFEFSKLFSKYTNGNYDSITNAGLPAIYCGFVILGLAVLFFFAKKIKWREKLGAFAILAILSVSFCVIKLDMVWHGFQYPNWFPYRYAFLFGFMLIYMALQAMCRMKIWDRELWKQKSAKVNAILRAGITAVLVIFVSVEMGVNGEALLAGLDNEFHYGTVEDYRKFIDKTEPLVEHIKENDDGFYRINQGYEYSKNDACLLGYHGMTHYSSTYNYLINALTPKLGISQGYFWNSGYGSNALLDSLFSIKYILADKAVPASYEKISQTEEAAAYSNPLCMPIAYGAPVSTLTPNLTAFSPFENQNHFFGALTGDEDQTYFTNYPAEAEQDGTQWTYHFTADSREPVYLYMRADGTSHAQVYVNDGYVGDYFSGETNGTLFLGNFAAGQEVTVRVEASAEGDVSLVYSEIARLNMDAVESALGTLRQNGIKLESTRGGKVEGSLTLNANQKIITSIPYDEGWTATIDGEKVELKKYADAFIALDCPEGEHKLEMNYVSRGFLPGAGVSIVCLLACIFYFAYCHIKGRV